RGGRCGNGPPRQRPRARTRRLTRTGPAGATTFEEDTAMPKEIRQIIPGGAWSWCTVLVTEPKQEITVTISSVPAFALHGDRRRVVPLVFPPWHGEDFVTADQIRSWGHGSGFLIDPLWTNDTIYNAIEALVREIRSSRQRKREEEAREAAREGAE